MGKWITCKVDKLLPTSIIKNEYDIEPFASIAKDNEHWVPYCEKAYAKEADSNYRYYSSTTGNFLTVVGLIVKDL